MRDANVYLLVAIIPCLIGCNNKKIADITIDRVSEDLTNAAKMYDKLDGFHEGLSKVCKDKKYGFIDKLGTEIIPCQYDEASDFKYGVSIVNFGEKVGIIDKEGNWVAPCIFDYINSFGNDSLASASINGKVGLLDAKGKTVIPFKYDEINDFREGLAWVKIDNKYGFINRTGELIIPCIYDDLYNGIGFSEGLAGVKKDGEWGYIDNQGSIIIPFNEGLTGVPFSSGLSTTFRKGIPLSTDSKSDLTTNARFEMAFINQKGQLACEYFPVHGLQGFRDGYCVVTGENGLEGLINRFGEFTIPCQYSLIANGFDDEYVSIEVNRRSGFARKSTGEITVPCIYEIDYDGWTFCEGLVPVKKNGKYGYINENNEVIIPFIYDDAGPFSEGFAVVIKYGKYGYVDRYGTDTFYHTTDL